MWAGCWAVRLNYYLERLVLVNKIMTGESLRGSWCTDFLLSVQWPLAWSWVEAAVPPTYSSRSIPPGMLKNQDGVRRDCTCLERKASGLKHPGTTNWIQGNQEVLGSGSIPFHWKPLWTGLGFFRFGFGSTLWGLLHTSLGKQVIIAHFQETTICSPLVAPSHFYRRIGFHGYYMAWCANYLATQRTD